MTKDEVKQLFLDDVEERRNKIRDYIMDETIPYEDREEVWIGTPHHLMTEIECIHLDDYEKKYGKINWYDFYIERCTTVDLRDLITLEELSEEQKCKDFISNCMKLGYHSFYYDW